MMDLLQNFFEILSKIGSNIIAHSYLLLGLFLHMRNRTTIKSSLMVGIAFQGLVLVLNLLMATINSVITNYKKLSSGFTAIDIGFATIGDLLDQFQQ